MEAVDRAGRLAAVGQRYGQLRSGADTRDWRDWDGLDAGRGHGLGISLLGGRRSGGLAADMGWGRPAFKSVRLILRVIVGHIS